MTTCALCGLRVLPEDRYCASCGTAVQQSEVVSNSDPFVGRVIGGSYKLQELVGVGGMGRVYRAEQVTLGRTVAVKVIHPHLLGDEQTVARFYQEARAASRLNHPNSVSIIDFGRSDDGVLYLAMEHLNGRDLAMIMDDTSELPFDRICRLLMGVLSALGEAHTLHIVHRDLKPENIIVSSTYTGEDLVKVVDFGLAMIVGGGTSITRPGLVCGTPDYMSPEQGRGDAVDGRGDIYAIGVLLFELLTGRLPYIDDTPTRVVLRHIGDPVPDPRVQNPRRGIPDRLAEITMRALAKSPSDRFATAEDMLGAIREASEDLRGRDGDPTRCPSCDAVSPAAMRYCGTCGERLPSAKVEQPIKSTSMRPSFYPTLGSNRIFVGRVEQFDRIAEARRGIASAHRVHVLGEPGAGKTRFLTEIAERATAADDLVVGVGDQPSGASIPYASIHSLLCELLEIKVPTVLGVESFEFISPLARAGMSEVLDSRGVQGLDEVSRAGAVAEAVREVVCHALAARGKRQAMLIFDDISSTDGLSQQVVGQLTSALVDVPALIVSSGHGPATGPNDETIPLGGLTIGEIRELLDRAPAARGVLERLTSDLPQSTWLPLHVEQLVALRINSADRTTPNLPDAIMQRLAKLDVEALRLLQVAAVLGRKCDIQLLRAVSATSSGLRDINHLIASDLVHVDSETITFVHPFIAEVVESAIPSEARRELHRRAFEATSAMMHTEPLRARFAYRGADPFVSLVVLEQAGDAARARGDHTGAVTCYQSAVKIARRQMLELGDDDQDSVVVMFSRKLGHALCRSGDLARADGVLREALDLTDPRREERARMLLEIGRVALTRGRPRDAMRVFGQSLEVAAGVFPAIEIELQVEMGRLRREEGVPQHAVNAFRRATELLVGEQSSLSRLALIRTEVAESLLDAQQPMEALLYMQSTVSLVGEEVPDAVRARLQGVLGEALRVNGNVVHANTAFDMAISLAGAAGDADGYRRWSRARYGSPRPGTSSAAVY